MPNDRDQTIAHWEDEISHQRSFIELKAHCSTAMAALNVLPKEPVDILFLDIQLPASPASRCSAHWHPPVVIFTTAHSAYADDAALIVTDATDRVLLRMPFTSGSASGQRTISFDGTLSQ